MPRILIALSLDDPRWLTAMPDADAVAKKAFAATLANMKPELKQCDCTVSLTLTDDRTIKALNSRWRGKDNATNVLSFETGAALLPLEGAPVALGDIVMALETIEAEAARDSKSFASHTTHLLVHGMAHLLGYNHEDDQEAAIMEAAEAQILSSLGIANPYISPDQI